jgi:capsular polysaccharide biosynthesis protein
MSEQALDLRRSVRIVWRHKIVVGIAAALGLAAGAAFTVLHPPMLTSEALVVLPPSAARSIGTQAVIADSDPVLAQAMRQVDPAVTLPTLHSRVQAKSLTPRIISISAQGVTAAQAEDTANAVANSYIAYISSTTIPGGRVTARVLQAATNATGTSLTKRLLIFGGLGVLVGAMVGAIVALAIGRGDRRLRERDEIADAIGVPVLASMPVHRPSDAGGWTKLLEEYRPGAVHAWSLRKTLHHLGLTDVRGGNAGSLTVLSLSSDPRALALGPQLAVYAASLGIPTAFVVGPQQDANATATLRAACDAPPSTQSRRSSHLRVSVRDHDSGDKQPNAPLTVVVTVVDPQTPRVVDTIATTLTVLGVSAGAATAEQLARVAASAAGDGRQIAGILVADPYPTDRTTGRLPQLTPPTHRRRPTRLTGTTTETS